MKRGIIGAMSGIAVGAVLGLAAAPAGALLITGSSGNLAASVEFQIGAGNTLVVTLTNTSTSDVLVPADVLTAVFFDINPALASALTRDKAVVANGSTVYYGPTDPGAVVGGEWAYNSGLSGAPASAALGVSSSGLGLFGPGNVFPGTNLQGPTSPDGLQYGITSAGDNLSTGNTPVTGTNALIKNSVVFTLGGLPDTFDLNRISNVSFQYGTALSEPNVPGAPEPASLLLMGTALGALGWRRRRRSASL